MKKLKKPEKLGENKKTKTKTTTTTRKRRKRRRRRIRERNEYIIFERGKRKCREDEGKKEREGMVEI